jgi:histidinol-phosphatase (PHP family)
MGSMTSLPPDNHVHSQFSWDALAGSMEATYERAVQIGLPALAFTEHADAVRLRTGSRQPSSARRGRRTRRRRARER